MPRTACAADEVGSWASSNGYCLDHVAGSLGWGSASVKSVLVTGASGLLGRAVCDATAELGWKTFGLGRATDVTPRVSHWIEANVAREWDFVALPKSVDVVVHLAQSRRFREFPEQANDIFGVNVAATARLLDYSFRVGATQFIYASTGGVYSSAPGQLNERSPLRSPGSLGAYFGSKVCGEILVESYASYLTTTILRPFFIYGPGQSRDMLLPRLFDKVRKAEPIQLRGDGGMLFNPIHVNDARDSILAAIDRPQVSVVNIAGPRIVSIRSAVEAMGRYLSLAPVFEQVEGDPANLIADTSLMRSSLHVPTILLEASVADLDDDFFGPR